MHVVFCFVHEALLGRTSVSNFEITSLDSVIHISNTFYVSTTTQQQKHIWGFEVFKKQMSVPLMYFEVPFHSSVTYFTIGIIIVQDLSKLKMS